MFKSLCGLAALAGLTGCTSYDPAQPFGCQAHQGGIPTVLTVRGCSVQLTPEWAVSAKHEPLRALLPDGVADPELDLYFFRHAATAPAWRQPVTGEAIVAYGNPWNPLDLSGLTMALPMRQSATGTVRVLTTMQTSRSEPIVPAVFFIAPAVEGYSGGPIVGADGAVLGLIWASVESQPHHDTTGTDIAIGDGVAVPSDTVWEAFVRDVGQAEPQATTVPQ